MDTQERAAIVNDVASALLDQLEPRLNAIEDTLKKVVRRQDTQQASLDLMDKDRNIWEDAIGVMRQIQEVLKQHRQHQQEATRNISNEVQHVKEGVQDLSSDLAHELAEQVGQIIKTVETRRVVLVKRSFFDRLFKRGVKANKKKGPTTEEVKPNNATDTTNQS